jgi:hypothetical protein
MLVCFQERVPWALGAREVTGVTPLRGAALSVDGSTTGRAPRLLGVRDVPAGESAYDPCTRGQP